MNLASPLVCAMQQLSSCRSAERLTEVLGEAGRRLTGADGITVVFRDGALCHYADENAIGPLWKGRRFPIHACISGWCMLQREQVVIPDVYADARVPHDVYKPTFVQSLAMVPIRTEDPIGAVGAYWATPHDASAAELEALQALADSAAAAIATIRLVAKLEQEIGRKNEFLSTLVHELRSPLPPILNSLHVLRLRGGQGGAAEKAREVIDRQVRNLSRLLDDLLDVARINGGKIQLRTERIDLTRVIRNSVDDRRATLNAAGVSLHLSLPHAPMWIMGDATRLEQVMANLLDNAAKFTPAGGSIAVEATAAADESAAAITVRDSGIGIAPEMLARIFDVMGQGDGTLHRGEDGLGLGLPIARGIVELHAGSIAAASNGFGKGAEFVVRLPCQSEAPALAGSSAMPASEQHHERVLVIEDNRDSADSLKMLLEACGYDVTVAYSGWQGLAAARAVQPSVVLCDIGLPGLDGFALAAALRQHPGTARARLIAVTGYGREQDRDRALASGFDIHLVKPVEPDSLLAQIAAPPA